MNIGSWLTGFLKVERNKSGVWSYWFGDTAFGNEKDFLKWSLTNPVLMTVIALRAKLYSQMEITAVDSKGNVIENLPEVKLLYKPNYFQSKQDLFFQQMWYLSAVGDCFTYQKRPFVTETPKALYNLIPDKINFGDVFEINSFISSNADINAFEKKTIEYTLNKSKINIPLRDVIPFYDLANGLVCDSWMRSNSRVEGIKGVLQNIEENLKSKNINLKMSQKYIASNKAGENGQPQIRPEDRKDIDDKFKMNALHITNANIEVTHLVKDLKNLYLDPSYRQDAISVLLAFDMNKEVLNYSESGASTYDNFGVGLVSVIQNSIQASADNTMNSFTNAWGLDEKGIKLVASYNHLPIMQSLVKEKIDTLKSLSDTLKTNIEIGIQSQSEAKDQYDKTKKDLGL